MKKYIVIFFLLQLTGCASTKIAPRTEALTTSSFRETYSVSRPPPKHLATKLQVKDAVTRSLSNVIEPIHFESGRSQIPEDYVNKLRTTIARLQDKQNVRLKFIGHTDDQALSDNIGNIYTDNYGLSRYRAQQVAGFIAEGLSIDKSKTIIVGNGPDFPVAPNDTEINRKFNRRVEIEVLYDEQVERTIQFDQSRRDIRELINNQKLTLSGGDRVKVTIPEGDEFSGIFEIDLDGSINIPYLQKIKTNKLTLNELESKIKDSLVLKGYFKRSFVSVTIEPLQWAETNVLVKGAVNNPGNVIINKRKTEEMAYDQQHASGDYAYRRLLSSAILAAGGLTPDADYHNITVIRNDVPYVADMSGMLEGNSVDDPMLVYGDQIIIPSVGYLQEALLRPSQLTAPGFRTYISNLSIGAGNNTGASVGKYTNNLPPGSRLLTAAVSGNCVGGTISVNAGRHVLLVGKDPITKNLRVMKRSLKQLIDAPNQDPINPYLLPEDHIACFDSEITNLRDVGRALSDFLGPLKIILGEQGL